MSFQDESRISCPYCGEAQWILVDPTVESQNYVEDCQVCCQPIEFSVTYIAGGDIRIIARHQDEA